MSRYRCGLCRKIVDRPERRAEWYREICNARNAEAIMRKVETKTKIERKHDV